MERAGHFSVDKKSLISLFIQRVHDTNHQNINEEISTVSKNRLYRKLYDEQFDNRYLFNIKEKYIRISISKFRPVPPEIRGRDFLANFD